MAICSSLVCVLSYTTQKLLLALNIGEGKQFFVLHLPKFLRTIPVSLSFNGQKPLLHSIMAVGKVDFRYYG